MYQPKEQVNIFGKSCLKKYPLVLFSDLTKLFFQKPQKKRFRPLKGVKKKNEYNEIFEILIFDICVHKVLTIDNIQQNQQQQQP